jgi:hypothetical protein
MGICQISRFRIAGPEASRRDHRQGDDDRQDNEVSEKECRLGRRRRELAEHFDLAEGLPDADEGVEIEQGRCAREVDPAPPAGQPVAV